MTATPPVIQESVEFLSDGLRLSGVLSYPETDSPLDLAVLMSPHACLGGDMDNSVLLALDAALIARRCATLRFNWRGVGASETRIPLEQQIAAFWENPAIDPATEPALRDAEAAVGFAAAAVAPRRLWAVGYSFGGVIALLLAARADVCGVAAVSPPIHQLTAAFPSPRPRWSVIARAGDDIGVEPAAHGRLLAALAPAVRSFTFGDTDHFYRGREEALARAVIGDLLGGI